MSHKAWIAGTAVVGGSLVLLSALAWLKYGEVIYFERITSLIAGCF